MRATTEKIKKERAELVKKLQCIRAEQGERGSRLNALERELRVREEAELKKTTGVTVYSASDYAGLSVGKYRFYYGYEATVCWTHGADAGCEDCDDEWAFTADVDGVEVLRIGRSRLGDNGMVMCLLHGIGQFLAQNI